VLMAPKSLLRHPLAASHASELVGGRFEPVLDDAEAAAHPQRVRRLGLCSGHIWAELQSNGRRAEADELALVRVEELYPFPQQQIMDVLDKYTHLEQVLWVQEEPQNMGAWTFVERKLRGVRELTYVGRPPQASPAEGWSEAHAAEQRRIVSEVLAVERKGVAAHAG